VFKGCLAIKILFIDLYWQVGFGGWRQRISQPELNRKKKKRLLRRDNSEWNRVDVFSFHPCVWVWGLTLSQ
jgi:hypothetical protein